MFDSKIVVCGEGDRTVTNPGETFLWQMVNDPLCQNLNFEGSSPCAFVQEGEANIECERGSGVMKKGDSVLLKAGERQKFPWLAYDNNMHTSSLDWLSVLVLL